ncbi:MAG: hypothetical protein AAGC85_21935, partial [Bacteroidota bacterium]
MTLKGIDAIKEGLGSVNTLLAVGNLSPRKGVPNNTSHKKRIAAEKILSSDIQLINSFSGKTFVVPG